MSIEISASSDLTIGADKVIKHKKGVYLLMVDTYKEGMKQAGKFIMPEQRSRGDKPLILANGVGYRSKILKAELSMSAGKRLRAKLNKVAEDRS